MLSGVCLCVILVYLRSVMCVNVYTCVRVVCYVCAQLQTHKHSAQCKHTVHTILHSVETQTNTPNSQTSAKRSHITQVETHSTSHLTFYTVWKHKQEQTQ